MSCRKNKNGLYPVRKVRPLIYDQRLHDPWQNVFIYLSVKDLFVLASVSRSFYHNIENYCQIICKKLSLESCVLGYFKYQLVLKQDTLVEHKLHGEHYKYRWLYVTWRRLRRVHRKSITKFAMDNLGNPTYIIRKYDNVVKREIVMFTSVIWLQFTHKFADILPGKYRAIMRMSNDKAPVKIRIYWEDSNGYHEKITEVRSYQWQGLRNRIRRLKRGKSIKLKGDACVTNYDSRNGWFDFCVADFKLHEVSNVVLEFSDIIDDWWKAGMRCDYAELRPIDWITN